MDQFKMFSGWNCSSAEFAIADGSHVDAFSQLLNSVLHCLVFWHWLGDRESIQPIEKML